MTACLFHSHRGLFAVAVLAACAAGCGTTTRFALRPPVLRDSDDRPLAKAPPEDAESEVANAIDVILFRPISHAFLFEPGGESRNVNSLDEVPDSTWYTNRTVAPADLERGTCPDAGPVPPFTIKKTKTGGTTPGFQVKDSRGEKYMVKLDSMAPRQPELSTSSDAIVSRIYWAIGFNVPCNDVAYIDPTDLRVDAKSEEVEPTGKKEQLTAARVAEIITAGTRRADGKMRVGASRFIPGEPVGTWRTEGTRADDPNDVIPHEDRRELRGEHFLAGWVGHWDSRGPNTFDAFKKTKGGGHVVHYFLDFSDSLGGNRRPPLIEPRLGHTTVGNVPNIAADAVTFGFARRPWDEVRIDPRYPNLGYYDLEHFVPMEFAPQTPLVRWGRATPSDLAWMARKIARIGIEHVRVAVRQGKLSNPAEEAKLIGVMMGRRAKVLRTSFARSSPLADLAVADGRRLCMVDLGITTGMSAPGEIGYSLELRTGEELSPSPSALTASRDGAGNLCVDLPHFAARGSPDDSADRYATLDVVRAHGSSRTTLRAHFYDLGPERGFALVGIERP